MKYDFFNNQESIGQIDLYKKKFFNHFENFLENEDIAIEKVKKDNSGDPEWLAHFNTCCNVLEKPIIILHCNRINDYINKNIKKKEDIPYLIELIIYHELSHWFIESFFEQGIPDQGDSQIYFHEALAQYFTFNILNADKDNEKKKFFERFCEDRYKDNARKKIIYMLWKKDATDDFELFNYDIYFVIEAIKECSKQNKQEWELLKEILKKQNVFD